MSELSDFFDAQDERAMERECGARGPHGEWCARAIGHDVDDKTAHRTHEHDKMRLVWRGPSPYSESRPTPASPEEHRT